PDGERDVDAPERRVLPDRPRSPRQVVTAAPMRYEVVIPVLDQLRYTEQCVQSLLAHGTPAEAILVIDNGSSDATPAWLASQPVRSVRNAVNLGWGGPRT